MGYWGWRPLVMGVFFSVWVVGCNVVAETSTSVSPTAYPQVTLTVGRFSTSRATPFESPPGQTPTRAASVPTELPHSPTPFIYVIQSGDTLLDIAIRYGLDVAALRAANPEQNLDVLQFGQTIVIPLAGSTPIFSPTPTPQALLLPQPACYETRAGTTVCLGRVENPLATAVERVMIEVRLEEHDGNTDIGTTTIEQIIIPPNSFAPYRVTFNVPWDAYSGVDALLLSADAVEGSEERFLTLDVAEESGEWIDGRFVVTATLTSRQSAEVLRAVVTLQDEAGRVIGYRVAALGGVPLEGGATIPLRVEIVPQPSSVDQTSTPRYTLYIEARSR